VQPLAGELVRGGNRKYLTRDERERLLKAAEQADRLRLDRGFLVGMRRIAATRYEDLAATGPAGRDLAREVTEDRR
jgi:hypothetical protein